MTTEKETGRSVMGSVNKAESDGTSELRREVGRLSYMLAWRERYMVRLEEILAGEEESREINLALLAFLVSALLQRVPALAHTKRGEDDVLHIPREALTGLMAGCRAAVEADAVECRIILPAAGEGSDPYEDRDDAEDEA